MLTITRVSRRFFLSATTAILLPVAALAQEAPTALPAVPVQTESGDTCPLHTENIDKKQVDAKSVLGTTDSASLLSGTPGVALASGGGISSLPIVQGLADDRNKTLVDGVPITSACPNHMNPAMSYIAPSNSGHITLVAGLTPVSAGGDSIGSVITVDPAAPMYAEHGEGYAVHGSAGTYYRSNNHQIGANGDVTAATENISLGYNGSWTRARDASDGNGDSILASAFESQSHNLALGMRNENEQLVLRAGHQLTPYEGFPNQRMDLTGNTSNYVNGGYTGEYGWGKLDGKIYWQHARHAMDFFMSERNTTMHMPMDTKATDAGYSLKAEVPLTKDDTLRIGNEFHHYHLDDWWPPVMTMVSAMGPNTFYNINDGRRDVLGTFAEWEKAWDNQWTSLLGVRNDTVMMDTGNVSGYNFTNNGGNNYLADSTAFNAQSHKKTDYNVDLTAMGRYEATAINTDEFGYARKTRSPNLYERYAWSTGTMASSMINWFGNGSDYVGNLHLRPETANTFSVSSGWHDAQRKDWSFKVTPYYTYVQDYIGVNLLKSNVTPGVNQLQFANHDAQIFGFDISGSKSLAKDESYGDFDVASTLGLAKGMQMNNGNSLYHMQPLTANVSLNHRLGSWSSTAELRMVDNKSVTNPLQNEPLTAGFAILNWRTSYQLDDITFAFGIDNLLNKQYYDPNGGSYISGWRSLGSTYDNTHAMEALPASGRSFNVGMTVKF
ncbi:MAG TPA: TonB-dependent receptor plug domain-containing protein [Candidatus Sulfotelmatobacter sp.]|jgi:iron complex outermembrane receptor protein|nr:TonB-dependent receptor plug domain-containing protein [Candidatus Sulfotelmatobacter sp.]